MIVEIDYPEIGCCPFCATRAVQSGESSIHENEIGYRCEVRPCTCAYGHFFLISVETVITDDDYIYNPRMFVHYLDWQEHVDITIEQGEHNTPLLYNEDDLWQIHQKMLKKIHDKK